MVFLMDPDDLSIFLQSEKLDFQKAVQPFTSKAGMQKLVLFLMTVLASDMP